MLFNHYSRNTRTFYDPCETLFILHYVNEILCLFEMESMKILLVQRFDLQSVSCARRVLCQAGELLHRGHDVWLTDFVHEIRHGEVPRVADSDGHGATVIPLERKITNFRVNIRKLYESVPKPDIVHCWKAYPDAFLPAYVLAKRWNVPLHYDYDDWETGIAAELTGSPLAGWCAGAWDRNVPLCASTISVASQFLKEKLLEWGVNESRIWDAPVGADTARFYPREKDAQLEQELTLQAPVFVYSGQLEVASYAEQAVRAMPDVLQKLPTASLLVLGGGRKLPMIRQLADELGISDHIRFTDYVPGEDIPRYLSLADCAVAPFEANDVTRAKSPLKIAEYLAMGLPVVASDIGEAPRMIGNAGTCVPCGDSAALAQGIISVLQRDDLDTLRDLARKRATSRYNWASHVDSLLMAYGKSLNTH